MDFIQRAMVNHGLIFFIVAVLMILGVWSVPKMNKNEFPSFTIPKGLIVALYPGATAEEIELQVTQPLEDKLFTYSEINKQHTYSETKDGAVYIYVDIEPWVKHTDQMWAKIRAGLETYKMTNLPQGVLAVVCVDDFGSTSSILLTMESPQRTPREMEDYARQLARELRTIPELGNIKTLGTQREEIAVEIDAQRLSQYAIDQKSLLAQLQLQGFRTVGGKVGDDNSLIQVEIPLQTVDEVKNQVVYANPLDGSIVRLKDIATITRRYPESTQFVHYYDGEEAKSSSVGEGNKGTCVIVDIQMSEGHNIVAFGHDVDKVLAHAHTYIPQDVQMHRITDQPKVVGASVVSFMKDIALSLVVVVAVMLLLFPLKTAMVAGIGVPICMIITFALMYFTGIELNTVTLAALIVVLGMIVDNAVIVVDGYSNELDNGRSCWDAASVSTKQLFVPMVVATLSISGMFFPMTKIITGVLGDFVKLFPWTICFALLVSIFYAVWVTPYLSTRFIHRQTEDSINWFERGQNWFFDKLQRGYKWLLGWCFRHPWLTIGLTMGLILLGLGLFTRLNVQMLPKAERDCFAVEIHLNEGSNVQQTAWISDSLAHILCHDQRVRSVTNIVGITSPRFHITYTPHIAADNFSQLIVKTVSNKATMELLQELSPRYENCFPNAYIRFKQMDYQVVKNPVELYIKGNDLKQMALIADSVKEFLNTIPQTQWVHDDYSECASTVRMVLKQDEARQLGVTQSLLSLYLHSALGGQTLTTLYEGEHTVPVILYTAGSDTLNYASLADQLIPTAYPGVWVPLRQVADLYPDWHHTNITRWNGERTITVGCDLRGNTSQPVVQKQLEKWVKTHLTELPEGIHLSYGGLTAANEETIPQIVWAVIAAIAVMFFVLLYHFKKVDIATLTLSSCVLTLFGAFLGLYIFQLDFSITAVLGVVALIGVIVRNAIMMYEYAEELHFGPRNLPVKEAAYEAGLRRMRPIFLTSATTALGVIPMIIARTPLWMPLGVVICLGTFFTLPLTLTFLPVAYWKIYDKPQVTKKVMTTVKAKKVLPILCLLVLPLTTAAEPLTLDSCLEMARRNNRDLQSAALNVDKAKQVKAQALTKYFPQISGTALGYHSLHPLVEVGIDDLSNASARDLLTTLYGNYGAALGLPSSLGFMQYGYMAGVSALQPIYVGGKIVNGNRLAQVGVEAAELQQQIAERDKLEMVEESYWLVVGLTDKQATLTATTHLLDTIHHVVEKAVEAGIAMPGDLLQVELRQSEMARTQIQLTNGIVLATRALCQSIGLPYNDSIELSDDSISIEHTPLPTEADGRLLPENQLLALQTKATELQYKMTLADALPQVAVGAAYGYGKLQADVVKELGHKTGNGAVMVTVSVPLTNWWETGHKLKAQSLAIEQAKLEQADKNELLALRNQQTYDQLVEAEWMLQQTTAALEKAKENYRLSSLNYKAGLNTITDLLTAQSLLMKAQNDCTDAKIVYRLRLRRFNDLNP